MQIKTGQLREALMLLDHVVPKKSKVDSIYHVLIKDGKITGTDLDIFVTLDIPGVEGECVLPHKAVYDLIKYVPASDMLTITPEGKQVKLEWPGGSAAYPAGDPGEFPETPAFQFKTKGILDGDSLIKAMMSVVDYCLTGDSKPILTGVALLLGPTTEAWGADGFRLACQKMRDSFPTEENIVIPADTVRVLAHLWAKLPAQPPLATSLINQLVAKREIRIGISEDGEKMVARFNRLTVVAKLLTGEIPTFKKLIPENQPRKLRLLGRELETGLARFKFLVKAKEKILRVVWTEDTLTLSASLEEKGSVSVNIPVQTEGGPGRFGVNMDYLTAFAKGKDGLITISSTDEKMPVQFQYANSPMVIVMPMFVNWDGRPAEKEEPAAPSAPENSTVPEEGEGEGEGEEEGKEEAETAETTAE